jgi:hypothetical protein
MAGSTLKKPIRGRRMGVGVQETILWLVKGKNHRQPIGSTR